jgi:hypothetical protein
VRSAPTRLAGISKSIAGKIGQLPLSFEENRGQFDSQVKFLSRGAGYGLYLSSGQATIVHQGKANVSNAGDASSLMAAFANSQVQTRSVTQLTWIGANPNAVPRGDGSQAGESNYLIGKDRAKWRRHVRHYGRVRVPELYSGIDLVYHGVQQQVELDYVVAPHADPKAIQVGISGPSLVSVNASGQLSISSAGDEMLLLPPTAYQEKNGHREIVEARYVLAESHRVGFELGPYDRSRPLVIDPVLTFAADFGTGSNFSLLTDVALDTTGNIYVTGATCDTNYPTTFGAFQQGGGNNLSDACFDAVVTKLNPTATELLYSTYVGGQTNVDFANRILVDTAGEATIVGTSASSDFPTTSGAYQTSGKGGLCNYSPYIQNQPCSDAFLLKLSADGSSLIYSTLFGGERAEIATGLVQDSSGNSYISGATDSALLPVNSSSYSTNYGGGTTCQMGYAPCFDGFVAKIKSDGSALLASTYFGGDDDDYAFSVALGPTGNVYITGTADSTNLPTTPGAYQTTHSGTVDNGDAYLAVFDSTLHTLQYSTFLGGSQEDISLNLRVDSTGAAYLTGSTLSPDLPTTAGAYLTTYQGPPANPDYSICVSALDESVLEQPSCGDVFLAKIDPSKTGAAQLVFSTYLGGSGNDFAYNLALDSQNNVWLIGDTNSAGFPTTTDAYFTPPSSSPLFLSEIKNDGTQLLFSTLLARVASNGAIGIGITIDPSDNVYIAGQGTVSATPGTYVSGSNLFVEKFSTGTSRPSVELSATSLSFGRPGTAAPLNSATPPQSVTLTNNGTGTLHLTVGLQANQYASSATTAVFSESDNCGPTLAAGAHCTINAIYQPSTALSSQYGDGAQIQIIDDAPGAPHAISLTGATGLGESASFTPATLTFSGQQPNTTSPVQSGYLNSSLTAANSLFVYTAGNPVVSGPNASEFTVDTSECAVGTDFCTLNITFIPGANATGTRTATVTVPSTAANSPQTLSLVGTVATGPFGVFGPAYVSTTTVGQSFNGSLVLKNTGATTLNITSVTASGANPSDYVLSNASGCNGYPSFSVPSQGTCLLNVRFTPSAAGTRTATFTLVDNESSPASVTLSGNGYVSGGPELLLTTTGNIVNNVAFYPDTVVGESTTYNQTLISINNVASPGPNSGVHLTVGLTGDFTQTNNCPPAGTALAGNAGCTFTVLFAPTVPGLRTGTLTITTDAPGGQTFTLNFAGNGVLIPVPNLTPQGINFGPQAVGSTSAPQTVTLMNSGSGPLNLSNVVLTGPFSNTTTCGSTLAGNSSCTYTFKFVPTVAGAAGGTLTAGTNAAGGLLAIGLNGTGVTGPVPVAQPTSLTFSTPQPVGTKSPTQAITFSNAGDTAFTIPGVVASQNFYETNNCPSSLGPHASCTINVSFAPTTDTYTSTSAPYFSTAGNVYVTVGASGSPFSIPVTGYSSPSTQAATNLAIVSSLNPSKVGQTVTFTATVTSQTTGTPTGTVTFFDGISQVSDPIALSAQGKATFTDSSLVLGSHDIYYEYSGDATFAPAISGEAFQIVSAGVPVIFSASPNSQTAGASAFTITVTGSDFAPSATVLWNGSARTTTFISSSQLSASITAADIAAPSPSGPAWDELTVSNGLGGISNILAFPVLTGGASPTIGSALRYVAVTPCRLVDTRNPAGPFGGPQIAGGASRNFTIPQNTVCNIPSNAAAYSLNVAVVPVGPLGYVTLWPAGQAQPVAATVSSIDGRVRSNAAIVPAGNGGAISVYASNSTDLVMDIDGYFTTSSAALEFYPVTPCRVVDTRNPAGTFGGPFLSGNTSRAFPLPTGACNLPITAQAYSLNLAVVPQGPLGYLTAWPTGQAQPGTANLSSTTGTVTANAAIVPAGTSGSIEIYASNSTDVIVDVNGYFAPPGPGGLSLYSLPPCRVLDTRNPSNATAGTGHAFSGELDENINSCGIPAGAQAYVTNATVVPSGAFGYLTMWPQGTSQPLVATLSALDATVTSNLAIVPTSTGAISTYAANPTQLVMDIFGFFGP